VTAGASDRVRVEWLHRVEAEYRSAAITQHLTLWLIQVGASPDLIRDGLRIVDDEMVHAEMSHGVYVAAGGADAPSIDREQLALPRSSGRALELDLASWGVRIFCLGETVAVPLFAHLRSACTVEVARSALDRILKDEVRHRQFGWDLLDQLLDHPDAELITEQIERDLPRMFADLERSYGDAIDDDQVAQEVTDGDRSWGMAPAREYAEILHQTFETDFAPRFADRGIDAGPAWNHRFDVLARLQNVN
jgi:1,2-phenylacetyl-CoA epoxidase catalytic subunit